MTLLSDKVKLVECVSFHFLFDVLYGILYKGIIYTHFDHCIVYQTIQCLDIYRLIRRVATLPLPSGILEENVVKDQIL